MNWLDFLLIIFIIISAIAGLRAGVIKSLLSLAGIIVGVVLAGRYYITFAEKITLIPSESAARIVAFIIILAAVTVVAGVIASIFSWIVSKIMLGWLNRLGGGLFGLAWGTILAGALLAIWTKYFGFSGTIADSSLARFLLDTFPLVLSLLPDEFNSVRSFFGT